MPQYVLPKQAMTSLAGAFASRRAGRVTTAAIRAFVAKYGVDMSEAANPDIASYRDVQRLFHARAAARRTTARRCALDLSGRRRDQPVRRDRRSRILQAKGHHYEVTALVGGDDALAEQFEHGSFATLYLSPARLPSRAYAVRRPAARG